MGVNKLKPTPRKWLLTIHILFSAILFGGAVIFLVLSIILANTNDAGVFTACYTVMHLLAKTSVRASTIGTLASGILLSVLTPWGLFRYNWLIAKQILTAVCILLGPIGMYFWTLKAVTIITAEGIQALSNPEFAVNRIQLWIGIAIQLLALLALFALSVFKPGKRRSKS
ncbi:DUF2269 family protein [Paenibacillus sp. OAS669]|uniref:DUF2269 family protein n=1 Tax=Paenibacillus sp. OAS669 TaxID=2663821 RepID=UPI0019EF481B|nr:DUF2269 family protein [Paenibacillus sp. OAS669]MBE1442126.1 hypothetical protein [Paenibacillus sp. OAS669]